MTSFVYILNLEADARVLTRLTVITTTEKSVLPISWSSIRRARLAVDDDIRRLLWLSRFKHYSGVMLYDCVYNEWTVSLTGAGSETFGGPRLPIAYSGFSRRGYP